MPCKTNRSWTIQEEQTLKSMRQAQIANNQVSWQKIAEELNWKFPKYFRTAKQCRQKYINYLQIKEKEELNQDWNQQELDLLHKLYKDIGPCWNYMASKIQNRYSSVQRRSEGCIKNKYNTCLRRAAKTLYNAEQIIKAKNAKKSIKNNILVAMINFVNQIKNIVQGLNLSINPQSKVFTFRSEILRLCFNPQSFTDEDLGELIKLIKSLNSKIRCFGVFKVKNKKLWNISERGLLNICQFDKIVIQNNVKTEQRREEQVAPQSIKQNIKVEGLEGYVQKNKPDQALSQISQFQNNLKFTPPVQLPQMVSFPPQNLCMLNQKHQDEVLKKQQAFYPYYDEYDASLHDMYIQFLPLNFGGQGAFMPLWNNDPN